MSAERFCKGLLLVFAIDDWIVAFFGIICVAGLEALWPGKAEHADMAARIHWMALDKLCILNSKDNFGPLIRLKRYFARKMAFPLFQAR